MGCVIIPRSLAAFGAARAEARALVKPEMGDEAFGTRPVAIERAAASWRCVAPATSLVAIRLDAPPRPSPTASTR